MKRERGREGGRERGGVIEREWRRGEGGREGGRAEREWRGKREGRRENYNAVRPAHTMM